MERSPGAASIEAELEHLVSEREQCAALRARVQALELEREAIEHALNEATDVPVPGVWDRVRTWLSHAASARATSEAQLDAWMARLGEIERERQRIRAELETRADVDSRFTRAIARKHEQLVGSAPDDPSCIALVGALALCASTQRALDELDAYLSRVESARDHAKLLVDTLTDAVTLGLIDNVIDLPMSEPLFARAKYSRVKYARKEAERLASNLRALGEVNHAAQVTGPRALFGLSDGDVAVIDALSTSADLILSHQSARWRGAAQRCKSHLDELLGSLLKQRRRLEILMSERTRQYHALALRA